MILVGCLLEHGVPQYGFVVFIARDQIYFVVNNLVLRVRRDSSVVYNKNDLYTQSSYIHGQVHMIVWFFLSQAGTSVCSASISIAIVERFP